MTRCAGVWICVAVVTLFFGAGEATAQGGFDLFGVDPPASGRASRPPRDIPGAPKKRAAPKARKREAPKADALPAETAKPAPAGQEAPPPPYEPQLTRLTEVLGALAFLRDLCGAGDGDDWRGKMSALLDAESPSGLRRERLVASFNHGFRGYELTYRVCTPNAKTVIARYLDEASKLSRDITYRYGSP